MSNVKFIFDIVVTRLSCPNQTSIYPEKCQVNVVFKKVSITITSSRINVSDFNAARRLEFESDPEDLRNSLERAGMPIVISYAGSIIGNAKMEFPESVLNKINLGMNDLIHVDTCEIMRQNKKIGTVEVLCRITIKCDDPVPELHNQPRTCADFKNVINNPDIMFLVGAPEPCPDPCDSCNNVNASEEGDKLLHLDLERYRRLNSQVDLNSVEKPGFNASCGLRKVTESYGDVIDSVTKTNKELDSSFSVNYKPVQKPPPRHLKKNVQPPIYPRVDRTIPIPLGTMEERGIKPIRYCPVCLFPMSWLPKFACCPNCGAKPMPMFNKSTKEKLTADKIMSEVVVKPQPKLGAEDFCVDPCMPKPKEEYENDECSPSRCTCKCGKMCAHCRIRKLCEDIFANKTEDHCPKVEPMSDEDFCVIPETESNCRPYLVRVFSELRDLYKINDTKIASQLKARCTQSLMTMKSRKSITGKESSVLGKMNKAASMGAIGDKIYNHDRPKLGHKTCVVQKKNVSRYHGWNWASSPEARNYGWRPGAIARPTSNIMKFFLDHESRKSAYNVCNKMYEQSKKRERNRHPVLNISKKNGEIFVTLRPLRTLGIEQHPIIFKIVKSDLAKVMRRIRRSLKDKGFVKCTCHQSLRLCTCRSERDKRIFLHALVKECKKYQIPSCADHLILTDTSESEMEYDFNITPPAGTKNPVLESKSRTANRSTQTTKGDRKYKELYPIQRKRYYRDFDCAVGNRFMVI